VNAKTEKSGCGLTERAVCSSKSKFYQRSGLTQGDWSACLSPQMRGSEGSSDVQTGLAGMSTIEEMIGLASELWLEELQH
jgi:hypothetical protein